MSSPLGLAHAAIPAIPEPWLLGLAGAGRMAEAAGALAARDEAIAHYDAQEDHPMWRRLEWGRIAPASWGAASGLDYGEVFRVLSATLQERAERIALAEADNYNGGVWFDSWDATLWEMGRLRSVNPGVPVTFLVGGANGSAKTFFAGAVMIRAMMHTQKRLFWCLTMDEPNSETVQQRCIYWWLPNDYKTQGGGIKGSARGKLKFNDSGGFTDNRFSLYHGASMEFRFWSKDVGTLEGPRPYAVWSDEEIPLKWLDGVERRLLTAAERTRGLCPMWQALLARKEREPGLRFPLEKIGELMMGFHLVTYTAKDGYTATVRMFMNQAQIREEVEADPELLPRRDKKGQIVGGERLPRLVYCKDPTKRARFLYAWENPLGGNWEGMRIKAKGKARAYILWWCYGVAEKGVDTPFPNFDVRIHVRPISWLPRRGTWYHTCDPVAAGGRQWFHLWALVSGEHRGWIAPGDIFIAHEYPQQDDFIPGLGLVGPWAEEGGAGDMGVRGPAQKAWAVGFAWRAGEIRRIERKLAEWVKPEKVDKSANSSNGDKPAQGANGSAAPQQTPAEDEVPPIYLPDGNRIMDSRAANTETENQTETTTLIEHMENNQLYFVPAGRDSGAESGSSRVRPGEQMINDMFFFDRELAELDPATGWLEIDPQKGPGPRLRIADHCTNLIAAIQNYKGVEADGSGKSPWKDPIDCLRYLVIARPEDISRVKKVSYNS